MIVEPVPLGPPSAPRRRLRVIALLVPVVLLGGVVAAGTLGPQPAPSPSPPAIAVVPSAPPEVVNDALPPDMPPPGVPARIAGLDVLTVVEALDQRGAGDLGGVTAIVGYLGVREQPACAGTFCTRTGILAAQPFSAATGFADIGLHLHPQLPVGVALPPAANLADVDPGPASPEAPAAILIARFDDPRARECLPAGRHCGEELVVERVVWVDGQSYPSMLAVDPGITGVPPTTILRTSGRVAERALGASATPMLTALVRPGSITYIDPAMAPIVAGLDQDVVWYVRGLQLAPGDDTIAWVVAAADGSLLLRGEVPIVRSTTAEQPPAPPDAFAGLPTLTPGDAVASRAAGAPDAPVVVTGHLKLDAPDGSCDGGALGPLGPWCTRTGILAEHAWAVTGADFDQLPAHLHVTLPVGVRVPDAVARMAVATAGPPLPVVVIGRFTGTRCDPADLAWCEEPFVVDRVTWADGVRSALTPLTEDRLQTGRRRANPFQLAVGAGQTPLLGVLAWPETVARLDPATADAVGRREASEPVWYLRVLEQEESGTASARGTPAVRWLLVDERLLEVLATGTTLAIADPDTVAATSHVPNPFPDAMAGLPVWSPAETRARVAADNGSSGPTAVAGYLRDVRASGPCTRTGPSARTLCERTAWLDHGSDQVADPAGIAVRIPAGVRVPGDAIGPEAEPLAVVILGRTHLNGNGCWATPTCELTLEVDRIAWADGADIAARPVIDPAVSSRSQSAARSSRGDAERLATGWSGTVLVTALVRRNGVDALDPVASEALTSGGSSAHPVWYVRALETRYGSMRYPPGDISPRISWVVVDAVTGQRLAWGTG